MTRLRALWPTQAALGCVVTPSTATRCRYLWWFESFAVVGGSGLFLAQTPVFGPVPDVVGGVPGGQDELGE
jgi:hypothetical protein